MLALPGSAYLYQGEELGLLEVSDLPEGALADPLWQRTGHQEKGRDGCRVPLPWTPDGTSFGFGDNGAHLPQPAWFGPLSAQTQDGAEDSTLTLYRRALARRRQLQAAEQLTWVQTGLDDTLMFERPGGWRSFTNFSAAPVALPAGEVLLSSAPVAQGQCPPTTTVWLRT